MASVADLTAGARSIGRYFSVISVIPSTLLVSFVFVLLNTGAWTAAPNWSRAFQAVTDIDLGTVTVLSAAALSLGLMLHPLQFALVQLYEGYWGRSGWVRRAAFYRSTRYSARRGSADKEYSNVLGEVKSEIVDPQRRLWVVQTATEARRFLASVPDDDGKMMPTRLGNVLRRYEEMAGRPYGLDAVSIVPYLALIAPGKDVAYLDDQRRNLDLAIRMSLTGLLAALVTIAFFWDDGLWMLLALVPYALAYLAYRGAVVAAHEYGIAMSALIMLNRFTLYERLRLPPPASTEDETEDEDEDELSHQVMALKAMLDMDPPTDPVEFVHPEDQPRLCQLVDRGSEDRGKASSAGDDDVGR